MFMTKVINASPILTNTTSHTVIACIMDEIIIILKECWYVIFDVRKMFTCKGSRARSFYRNSLKALYMTK